MATITTCDICDQPAGRLPIRVSLPGPIHPHKGEAIGQQAADICPTCLSRYVPGLTAPEPLRQIRLRRVASQIDALQKSIPNE